MLSVIVLRKRNVIIHANLIDFIRDVKRFWPSEI